MHYPSYFYGGLVAVVIGTLIIIFRTPISRGMQKVWDSSRSQPLRPTTPMFFLWGGLMLVGGGIWSVVRAFL